MQKLGSQGVRDERIQEMAPQQPKVGAAEGWAGGRKAEKQESGREREKVPDPEALAWRERGKAEKWACYMKRFSVT